MVLSKQRRHLLQLPDYKIKNVFPFTLHHIFHTWRRRKHQRHTPEQVHQIIIIHGTHSTYLCQVGRKFRITVRFLKLLNLFYGFIAQHDYFIKILPCSLNGIIIHSPLMEIEPLPESAIIPVAATGRHNGLIGSESIQVIHPASCPLQSLAIREPTYIIIE